MTPKKSKPASKAVKKAPKAASSKAKAVTSETAVLDASSEGDADSDEFEAASAARAGGGGADPGLTAAMAASAASSSLKNFRHHPDMENFYRFIYENDLRYEALTIIDVILKDKMEKKAKAKTKH